VAAGPSLTHSRHARPKISAAQTDPGIFRAAYRRFQKREPCVDGSRMGIYGYSRGGMAASLLAVNDDVQAVVLSAGIYDFKEAYDEVTIKGIKGIRA
jgi:dienelactone hydrolase